MDKKALSERDICSKFITPAIQRAGWDIVTQVREEFGFTKGRIHVRGKLVTRGKAKRVDYLLLCKQNIPLALIEAKDNTHGVGDGMQQALDYAHTAADRLRTLLPQALDTLADALKNPETPGRVSVALAVVKLAGPLPLVPPEPIDADEIVRRIVETERQRLRDTDEALDEYDGLPDHDAHTKAVRKRLALLAGPPDAPTAVPALPLWS